MAATVRIKTHNNSTLEGLELENFSTEETLAALLEQFKAFSSGFTTASVQTNTKTDKVQTKLEKLVAGLTGTGVGAEAVAGSNKVSDVVSKIFNCPSSPSNFEYNMNFILRENDSEV